MYIITFWFISIEPVGILVSNLDNPKSLLTIKPPSGFPPSYVTELLISEVNWGSSNLLKFFCWYGWPLVKVLVLIKDKDEVVLLDNLMSALADTI